MNEINSIEQVVIPEVPNVIDNGQLVIYVPIGTINSPGLNTYNENDFQIINGKVFLKNIQKVISVNNEGKTVELNLTENYLSADLKDKNSYLKAEEQTFTKEQIKIIKNNLQIFGASIIPNNEEKVDEVLETLNVDGTNYGVKGFISVDVLLEEVD